MSSSDVGSYEFQRSSWMHMEECPGPLARSTSDGSADDGKRFHFSGSAGSFIGMSSAPLSTFDVVILHVALFFYFL